MFGQGAVQWRAAIGSGSYATLTGAHFGNRTRTFRHDDDREREVEVEDCALTVPYSSQVLAIGYQVKTPDGNEWGIHQVMNESQHGLYRYTLRRDVTDRYTPDRGKTG